MVGTKWVWLYGGCVNKMGVVIWWVWYIFN